MIDVKPIEAERDKLVELVVRLRRDIADPPIFSYESSISGWKTALKQCEEQHLPFIEKELQVARSGSAQAAKNALVRIALAAELVESVIGYAAATAVAARARSLGKAVGEVAGEAVNTVGEAIAEGAKGAVLGAVSGSGAGTVFLLLAVAVTAYFLVVRR